MLESLILSIIGLGAGYIIKKLESLDSRVDSIHLDLIELRTLYFVEKRVPPRGKREDRQEG